jgi:hypothetical protein
METYNGWTNYETWVVKLWMDNDGELSYWIKEADRMDLYELETAIKEQYQDAMPEIQNGPYSDLMQAALDSVNWREIAESIKDEADEENEEEEEEA